MMKNKLLRLFELDYRSLALSRILIGLALLKDLIEMIPHIEMFYTEKGLLPLTAVISEVSLPWSWSIFFMNDHVLFVKGLFIIYASLLVLFIIGYKTRVTTFLIWVFLVSIHNRNWMGLNGGDELIRTCLLIMSFLPMGARYSIDYALTAKKDHSPYLYSTWGVLLFVQLALMYICSSLHKSHPIWNQDFTALSYAIYLDPFTKFPAEFLKPFPNLLKALTFTVYYIEKYFVSIIFLGLIPRLKNMSRFVIVFGFALLHIGITTFMNVGNFSLYAIALWTAFLPGVFWFNVTYRKESSLNIYYDGNCSFCEKLVRILLTILASKELFLYQAQSSEEIHSKMLENDSWVVKDNEGNLYYGFEAFIEVLLRSHFQFMVPLLRLNPIKKTGEWLYQLVAKNRKFFSKLTLFIQENKTLKNKNSLLIEILAIPLFVFISYWCLHQLKIPPYKNYSPQLTLANQWLHTYQSWNVFSPYPKDLNIWFQLRGVLNNQSSVELMLPGKVPYSPKITSQIIRNRFDSKIIRKTFMRMETDQVMRERIASYYCNIWNKNPLNKTPLDKVEIFMGKEHIHKPHEVKPLGIELIHSKFCNK